MARALRPCNGPGGGARCPTRELIPRGGSRCPSCASTADQRRRPDGNPYGSKGHTTFRTRVLAAHPICVLCHRLHSNVADHYPRSRRDLVALGLDPNDPQYGRGLCDSCHNKETAQHQPGGWNAR